MLIQRKSDKKFLTLSFGWVADPMNFSLATTSQDRLWNVCSKIGIHPGKIELVRFEDAINSIV
jgi:hypothetical protein